MDSMAETIADRRRHFVTPGACTDMFLLEDLALLQEEAC
jgi:hypothetical protein